MVALLASMELAAAQWFWDGLGRGATTYLLNAVGIRKLLRLRVELSLSWFIPRAWHQSFWGRGHKGRDFSSFKHFCGHLPMPPMAVFSMGTYSYQFLKRLVHHLQGRLVCLFPCLFQRDFFFPIKYMCSKSALGFFLYTVVRTGVCESDELTSAHTLNGLIQGPLKNSVSLKM